MIKVLFSDRVKIQDAFEAWCVKNQTTRSVTRFVAFMQHKGWLNEDKVLTDLKNVTLD